MPSRRQIGDNPYRSRIQSAGPHLPVRHVSDAGVNSHPSPLSGSFRLEPHATLHAVRRLL